MRRVHQRPFLQAMMQPMGVAADPGTTDTGDRQTSDAHRHHARLVYFSRFLLQLLALNPVMSCAAGYVPQLRSLGFRVTSQRLAILHVLLNSGAHLLPSQVYERARRKARGLSPPTVYRTLNFLARYGFVQPALNAQKHVVYQISPHGHHHLLCTSCGRSIEVEHELVDEFYRTLESRSGYSLTASHLTFFGLCRACRHLEPREIRNASLNT